MRTKTRKLSKATIFFAQSKQYLCAKRYEIRVSEMPETLDFTGFPASINKEKEIKSCYINI